MQTKVTMVTVAAKQASHDVVWFGFVQRINRFELKSHPIFPLQRCNQETGQDSQHEKNAFLHGSLTHFIISFHSTPRKFTVSQKAEQAGAHQ